MDAVERLWASFVALGPFKLIAEQMSVVDFDEAAKQTPHSPDLRKLFEVLGSNTPNPATMADAKNEQPFVSPLAWAYFSSYQATVVGAFARLKILQSGIRDSGKLLKKTFALDLLKTSLPEHTEYIEKHGATKSLLEELEKRLLAELTKILEGADIDAASVARSAEIMTAVEKATSERDKQLTDAGVKPAQ